MSVKSSARPHDAALRAMIAKGNVVGIRRHRKEGARLPAHKSRRHPVFKWLASLPRDEDLSSSVDVVDVLLEIGLPPDWGPSANNTEIKALPAPSQKYFNASLFPLRFLGNPQWNENQGATLIERLARQGQFKAAAHLVSRLPVDRMVDPEDNTSRTNPMSGLMYAGAWGAAHLLLERIKEHPEALNRLSFWKHIDRAMMYSAVTEDPRALVFLDELAKLRPQVLSEDYQKECQRIRMRVIGTYQALSPLGLDRYLSWFPEDLREMLEPMEFSPLRARHLWRNLLSRACVLGPEDPLWRSIFDQVVKIGTIDRPVDAIEFKERSSVLSKVPRKHRVPALPASLLDTLILQVDPRSWVGIPKDNSDEKTMALLNKRVKNWSAVITQLLTHGANPGYERTKNRFHWTYPEIFTRNSWVFDLEGRLPPKEWWRTHPAFMSPNPRTGNGPFQVVRGPKQWSYWQQAGFDPAARNKHGQSAFCSSLLPNLIEPGNDARDTAKLVAALLDENPSLWSEEFKGMSMRDLAGAHPSLMKSLNKAGLMPGPQAATVAIKCARVDVLAGLDIKTQKPPEGWTFKGWAHHHQSPAGSGTTRRSRLSNMVEMFQRHPIEPEDCPGVWLRNAINIQGSDWGSYVAPFCSEVRWGACEDWSDICLLKLAAGLDQALTQYSIASPPEDILLRSWTLLLHPSTQSEMLDFKLGVSEDFIGAINTFISIIPPSQKMLAQWQGFLVSLSEKDRATIENAIEGTRIDAWVQMLEFEGRTASAVGARSRGVRL